MRPRRCYTVMAADRLNVTRPAQASCGQDNAAKRSGPASRRINRIEDEVYREMLRLESGRSGSQLGLALALLRAAVQRESLADSGDFQRWFVEICPRGLKMIEASLKQRAVQEIPHA